MNQLLRFFGNFFKAIMNRWPFGLAYHWDKYLLALESKKSYGCVKKRREISEKKLKTYPFESFKKMVIFSDKINHHDFPDTISGLKIIEASPTECIEDGFNIDLFKNALIVLTNNSVQAIGVEKLTAIKRQVFSSIFIVHDWDNHHWIRSSIDSMLIADLYIPAHIESNLIASRFSVNIGMYIHPGVTQWSKSFLSENFEYILKAKRENFPLGRHTKYKQFKYRNNILKKLNKLYTPAEHSFIRLDTKYGDLTEIDRLRDWVKYKAHWVVPTLNDLPIRFFDALVTGGIPMVPVSLVVQLNFMGIPRNLYETYELCDIDEPSALIIKVINKFDKEGAQGIIRRYQFVIENFHAENTMEKIVKEVKIRMSDNEVDY
jgi:hypothetical protein